MVKTKVPNCLKTILFKRREFGNIVNELIKTKRLLEGNLCNLFSALMSLCDSDTKNQVEQVLRS